MSSEPAAATANVIPPESRRVVTGVGEDGKAKILLDDRKGLIQAFGENAKFQYLWWTDEVPVDLSHKTSVDPTLAGKNFEISNKGVIAVNVWMGPGQASPMHLTHSIDYGLVLEGEIELELDGGDKTLLKAGDLVVQRETNHKWYNPHATQWTKMFFVLAASKTAFEASL